MTVEAALKIVRHKEWKGNEGDIVFAAATLMENCETDARIEIADMLRCLDYRGVVAEFGARCLYVRTGRDGLGWKPALGGIGFVTDKRDWLKYLAENQFDPETERQP